MEVGWGHAAFGALLGALAALAAWLFAPKAWLAAPGAWRVAPGTWWGAPRARARRAAAAVVGGAAPGPPDYAREISAAGLGVPGATEVDVYLLEAPIAGASPAELETQARALSEKVPGGRSMEPPKLNVMMHAGLGVVCRLEGGGVVYRSYNMEARSGMTSALLPSLSELRRAALTGDITWSNAVMVVELLPTGPYGWHGPGARAKNPYWEQETKVFSSVPVATFDAFLRWAREYPEMFPLYRGCRLVLSPAEKGGTRAAGEGGAPPRVLLEANTCGSFALRAFTRLAALGAKPLQEKDGSCVLVRTNVATLYTEEEDVTPCSRRELKKWARQALGGFQTAKGLHCTAESEKKAAMEAAEGRGRKWLHRRLHDIHTGASNAGQLVRLRGFVMGMGGRMILSGAQDTSVSHLTLIDTARMAPPAYDALPAVGALSDLPGRQRGLASLQAASRLVASESRAYGRPREAAGVLAAARAALAAARKRE